MMLLVGGVRLPLHKGAEEAAAAALEKAGLKPGDAQRVVPHKVSVDARRRPPVLEYTMAVYPKDPAKAARLAGPNLRWVRQTEDEPRPGSEVLPGPVVVCGLGPAGLFAALELAEAGFAPLVLERGPAMDERRAAVAAFEASGGLNGEANIQFGEGGAGTFSDGKLRTRIKDPLCQKVTRRLLEAGAPEDIAWRSHPHIGTDKLRGVFVALRRRLVMLGAEVRFGTRMDALVTQSGRLAAVSAGGGTLPCAALVLACGHSARDTFAALRAAGVELEAKPFSVGVRIEHLQRTIDEGLYHEAAGHPALPPGEYQLSTKCGGCGVYTFCMCPGGSLVAAASEAGGVVTNGMSPHARSGPNANAALVAGVDAADFGGDPFAAIAFQRRLEQAAYAAGGGSLSGGNDYTAPAETQQSFLAGEGRLVLGSVQPTYPRGVAAADLGALLPLHITQALRGGLAAFGRQLPGYAAPDAVLTGLETRTSSPVRVPRAADGQCPSLPGLYPCGEGPGYAGGIMSAAVDGIRTARAIIETYAPPR